jgi:hypothetical protein
MKGYEILPWPHQFLRHIKTEFVLNGTALMSDFSGTTAMFDERSAFEKYANNVIINRYYDTDIGRPFGEDHIPSNHEL